MTLAVPQWGLFVEGWPLGERCAVCQYGSALQLEVAVVMNHYKAVQCIGHNVTLGEHWL